eukprot:1315580-Rhodomonas_salina.2
MNKLTSQSFQDSFTDWCCLKDPALEVASAPARAPPAQRDSAAHLKELTEAMEISFRKLEKLVQTELLASTKRIDPIAVEMSAHQPNLDAVLQRRSSSTCPSKTASLSRTSSSPPSPKSTASKASNLVLLAIFLWIFCLIATICHLASMPGANLPRQARTRSFEHQTHAFARQMR